MRPVVAAVHTGRVLSKICLKFNMDGLVTFIVKSVNSYTSIQYFRFFFRKIVVNIVSLELRPVSKEKPGFLKK